MSALDIQPDARAASSMPVLTHQTRASVASSRLPPPPPPQIMEPVPPEPKPLRQLVTSHPPHPTWDDESSPDQPYENPYLTRDIENVLWLPRDPCGILNLDDTVKIHKCLTSTPGLGDLNHVGDEGEEDDLGIMSLISSNDSDDGEGEIKMEETVHDRLDARLVESPDALLPASPLDTAGAQLQEDAVSEVKLSQSMLRPEDANGEVHRRKTTSHVGTEDARYRRLSELSRAGSSPHRRAPVLVGQVQAPSSGYRSFSGGSRVSRRSGRSFLSGSDRHTTGLPATSEEGSIRPPFRSQTSITRSTLTVVHASGASDGASLTRGSTRASARSTRTARQVLSEMGGSPSVHARHFTGHTSAHEAVIEEVIAEERDAAEQREIEEEEEAARAAQRRAWWKAWAFASTEPEPETETETQGLPTHADP
jgi:hypothetical protein